LANQQMILAQLFEYAGRVQDSGAFPTNGLISYWSMDSVSGSDVSDDFGTNDATTVSSPSFVASDVRGDAVSLNGTDQYITTPIQSLFSSNTSHSVSLWIKADDSGWNGLFGNRKRDGATASYYGILLAIRGSAPIGAVTYQRWLGLPTAAAATTTNTISVGVWHHIVCTYNGAEMKIYFSGNLESSLNSVSQIDDTFVYSARIGDAGDTIDHHDGLIDEVAIWNRAISSNEVSTIYNSGAGRFYTP